MSIYATDVSLLAPPAPKAKKGGKKKAAPAVEEPAAPAVPAAPVKKPRTEAQIAATKKAAETRKANKAAEAALKLEIEKTEKLLVETVAKKENKRKRKAAAAALEQEATPSVSTEEIVDQEVAKVVKKPRAPKAAKAPVIAPPVEEPPEYLKKYVQGVMKAQNETSEVKKPQKQIREEAAEHSKATWGDGVKRDIVRSEVDNHMNRMYRMMFPQR